LLFLFSRKFEFDSFFSIWSLDNFYFFEISLIVKGRILEKPCLMAKIHHLMELLKALDAEVFAAIDTIH
jgi:hypothetical protein